MIGWVDGQAGASGDMLLGALVDAGVPLAVMQDAVGLLDLGIALTATTVTRGGLGAVKVDVQAPQDRTRRGLAEVLRLVDRLPDPAPATEVFTRLAQAEAAVHRVPVEQVHFHEVGALDALADVVGVLAGLDHLQLTELHCSSLALGSGSTRGAHGPIPVPAPAVLALLAGAPVFAGPSPHEATTPTGAALLAATVTHWGPLPAIRPTATGCGAGGRDPEEVANVLRLVLGEPVAMTTGSAVVIEANVDDLDPRVWPQVLAQLMAEGASDAWLTPIVMKKGRPANTVSVLCTSDRAAALRGVVFRETTTIGLRERPVTKHALPRTESTVTVQGCPVRVKTSWYDGQPVTRTPEWDDVLSVAEQTRRPAAAVLAEAVAAAEQAGDGAAAEG